MRVHISLKWEERLSINKIHGQSTENFLFHLSWTETCVVCIKCMSMSETYLDNKKRKIGFFIYHAIYTNLNHTDDDGNDHNAVIDIQKKNKKKIHVKTMYTHC